MKIFSFADIPQASAAAAEFIAEQAREAISKRDRFSFVLTGGKTPETLYGLLGKPPYNTTIPWHKTHLFWGDERCVQPDHPDSNYLLALKNLLQHINIPAANIHRMHGELGASSGANDYDRVVSEFLSLENRQDNIPLENGFDLTLLGMGGDGHIASLFPSHSLLEERSRLVAPVEEAAGSPPVPRITMTLPLLNSSRKVLMLVSGSRKLQIVDSIRKNDKQAGSYPAALIRPTGDILWYTAEK